LIWRILLPNRGRPNKNNKDEEEEEEEQQQQQGSHAAENTQ